MTDPDERQRLYELACVDELQFLTDMRVEFVRLRDQEQKVFSDAQTSSLGFAIRTLVTEENAPPLREAEAQIEFRGVLYGAFTFGHAILKNRQKLIFLVRHAPATRTLEAPFFDYASVAGRVLPRECRGEIGYTSNSESEWLAFLFLREGRTEDYTWERPIATSLDAVEELIKHLPIGGQHLGVNPVAGATLFEGGSRDRFEEPAQNIFRKDNDTWTVRFKGGDIQTGIANLTGARDIAYLLRNPNKDNDILDLPDNRIQSPRKSTPSVALLSGESLEFTEQNPQTYNTPVATKGDYFELLRQIAERSRQLEDEDDELVRRELELEIEALRSQKNRDFDKAGEPRRLPSDLTKIIEKTQKRVLREFIPKRLSTRLPELADYLYDKLTISRKCRYSTDVEMFWDVGSEK